MKPALESLEDEVLTADEAAAFLKVTRKRLYQLPIPCSRLSVKTRRYFRQDLVDFLKRKRLVAA